MAMVLPRPSGVDHHVLPLRQPSNGAPLEERKLVFWNPICCDASLQLLAQFQTILCLQAFHLPGLKKKK
jgi:hypothetical protein